MTDSISELTKAVCYCKHKDLLDADIRDVMMDIFRYGVCDETISEMFIAAKNKEEFNLAFNGIPVFKDPKLIKGDYVFGYTQKGNELRSFIQLLNCHGAAMANSGSGKTNYYYFEILQIARHIKSLQLFDIRKRDFVWLKPMLAEQGIHLFVLPADSLRINPLQVPRGLKLSSWIPRIADLLTQTLELPPRATKLFQSKLYPLYNKFNTDKQIYPVIQDLFREFKNDTQSNHQARSAILDSLEPLILERGQNLAYRFGWPSHELVKKHLAFELSSSSEACKNLLMNTLIVPEVTSRIERGVYNTKLEIMIYADEAERLCSSSNQSSVLAELISYVRSTGIGIRFNFQSSNILPQIISNTSVKVLGRFGDIADGNSVGRSMGLSSEQILWCQINLEPGTFVAKFSEGQWRYPFVFKVPLIELPKCLPSDLYDDNPFPEIKTVYASEYDTWGQTPQINLPVEDKIFDSEQELEFCKAVASNPMQPSSSYPKIAGISSKNARKIRRQLIAKGFITEHKLDPSGRGRTTILLEILPAGFTAIQKYQEQMK